jgi:hypothetical protein
LLGNATTDSCVAASQTSVNGVEKITATTAALAGHSATCFEILSGGTSTANQIYKAGNLPVVTMKAFPSTLPVTDNNTRVYLGISDRAGAGDANIAAEPSNGIFFTNCSTYSTTAPTGCSNTTWYGVTANSGTATVVTCSLNTQPLNNSFAYLRFEVRSTSEVHFYADYNTASFGVVENECGTGSTTNIPSIQLAPWWQVSDLNASGANLTTALQLDYFRAWQDDNSTGGSDSPTGTTTDTTPDGQSIQTEAPITPDPNQSDPNTEGSFFNFMGAASEDTTFYHNVFIKGTLYVDKIKANEIEGLSIFTDQLASLQQKLAEATSTSTNPTSATNNNTVIQTATTTLNLSDGLTVGGDANFHGNVFFYKLVTFTEKTLFNNDVTFAAHIATDGAAPSYNLETGAGANTASASVDGNDNSGSLSVTAGDSPAAGKVISVTFAKPYAKAPRIILSATNDQAAGVKYYVQSTATGFAIYATDPLNSGANLTFNYFVIQ